MVVTLPVINVGTAVDGSSPKTKAQWSGKIVNKQLMKSKQCGKMRNLLILEKYFVKTTYSDIKYHLKMCCFHGIFAKKK